MSGDAPDPEVEALRAEVERLREEVQTTELRTAEATVELQQQARRQGWWRPVSVTVLIVIMAILAPLAIVAQWAHSEISDTDRYVESVTPLASDPDVQAAVIDRVTQEITTRLQIQAVTQQAIDALAAQGLPPTAATSLSALSGPLSTAIEGFVENAVTKLVESAQFEEAWVEANRQAHASMVAILTGKTDGTVQVSGNAVSINLATVIDSVKQILIDQGFGLAARLPAVDAQFTIFESADITKAQNAFRLLGAVATLLPILALLCLGGAVAVARSRRRALLAGTLVLAGSMLLLGVILNGFRMVYLDAIPPEHLPSAAAGAIYDTLAYFIRLNLRAVLVLSLTIAFIAWVTGPGNTPTAVRRGSSRAIGFVRSGSERAGFNTGRLGTFLDAYKKPLRVAVLAVALLVYVMEDHPTGNFTIVLVVISALVLLVIELLARPPVAVEADPGSAPGTPGAP